MSGKHTPGPWEVGPVNESRTSGVYGEIAIQAANGYFPACAIPCGFDGDSMHRVTQANAHLIAAAPELFEELQTEQALVCTRECPRVDGELVAGHGDHCKRLSDVLAKAEGRS